MALAGAIRYVKGYIELFVKDEMKQGLAKASRGLTQFAGNVRTVAFATGAMTAGLTAAVTPVVQQFMEFDDQMRLLRGILNVNETAFGSLNERIRELGRTTSFTSQQIGEAAISLARAGLSQREIEGVLGSVLNLSRATRTELATAAEIAAKTMNIFGLEVEEMEMTMDALVTTTNRSATTMEDLFVALQYAGPLAAATGQDVRDMAAAIGTLGDVGIEASRAGTQLRTVLSKLSDPRVQERMKELGVEVRNAEGNFRPLQDIALDLWNALGDRTAVERAGVFSQLFQIRAKDAIMLLGQNHEAFKELRQEIEDGEGAAARLAREMDAGLGGAFRMLRSAIQDLNIELGKSMVDALTIVFSLVKGVTNALNEFFKQNQAVAVVIGSVVIAAIVAAAAMTVFSLSLLALAAAIQAAMIVWTAITAAFASTVGVVFIVIGAVAALAAAMGVVIGLLSLTTQAGNLVMRRFLATIKEVAQYAEFAGEVIANAMKAEGLEAAMMEAAESAKIIWGEFMDWFGQNWIWMLKAMNDAMIKFGWMMGKNFMKALVNATGFEENVRLLFRIFEKNFANYPLLGRWVRPGTGDAIASGLIDAMFPGAGMLFGGGDPEGRRARQEARNAEYLAKIKARELALRRSITEELKEQNRVEADAQRAAVMAAVPGIEAVGTFAGFMSQRIAPQPVTSSQEDTNKWLEKINDSMAENTSTLKSIKEDGITMEYAQ